MKTIFTIKSSSIVLTAKRGRFFSLSLKISSCWGTWLETSKIQIDWSADYNDVLIVAFGPKGRVAF